MTKNQIDIAELEDFKGTLKELKEIASDIQTWESILSQIQQAEEGDNKK